MQSSSLAPSSTPTSPVKSSFSSPSLPRLPSSSTFASYHESSIQNPSASEDPRPSLLPNPLAVDTTPPNPPSGYTRTYTKSFSVGTPHHPSQFQPQVRRIKTSLSALASLDPSHLANRNYDPNADTKLIAIRVRYVSKDLWIRIDIPRNVPVHQARDLILKKCQLTLAPPSAPSSLAETSLQDAPTPTGLNFPDIDAPSLDIFSGTDTNTESQRAPEDKLLAPDPNRTPTNKAARKANGSIQTSRSDNSISKSLKSNNSSGQSGKHFERELPALSDIMADCPDDGPPASESMKKECESWRASFGLFWVANGHWLDDSRLMNSYSLEPHDLLELQLRNHYIQLPPPGGHLNYSDHYAEGVLFKLSKKSRPSLLTSNGKDSTGVWKERWVVLQGTKLLIYHKRKDTTKKTIQLPTPLQMVTRVLPPNSRHQYKFTMSTAAPMSSTLIALDMSPDPNAPKLCFRGASENIH
ncbi:hypothetical protein BGZ74_008111 [Mortierella antarctica]|nr:hypothetical protein BGZ74_008111 [Mortierella antarctica]